MLIERFEVPDLFYGIEVSPTDPSETIEPISIEVLQGASIAISVGDVAEGRFDRGTAAQIEVTREGYDEPLAFGEGYVADFELIADRSSALFLGGIRETANWQVAVVSEAGQSRAVRIAVFQRGVRLLKWVRNSWIAHKCKICKVALRHLILDLISFGMAEGIAVAEVSDAGRAVVEAASGANEMLADLLARVADLLGVAVDDLKSMLEWAEETWEFVGKELDKWLTAICRKLGFC